MAVLLLILSSIIGMMFGVITFFIGGGLVWCIGAYALTGHLAFAFLLSRLTSQDIDEKHLDEIEHDMQALQEEQERSRAALPQRSITLFGTLRQREAAMKAAISTR